MLILVFILFTLLNQYPASQVQEQPISTVVEFEDREIPIGITTSIAFNPVTESIYFLHNPSGRLIESTRHGETRTLDTLSFEFSDEYHFMAVQQDGRHIYFWERGLGQVYEYDLQEMDLSHHSDTDVSKYMFYHGAFVDAKDRIFARGGYGFWEYRGLLLKYDPIKTEWVLESRDFPSQTVYGYPNELWNAPEMNRFNYLIKSRHQYLDEDFYEVGYYDLNAQRWIIQKEFMIREALPFTSSRPLKKKSYYRDPTSRLVNLNGPYFWNEEKLSLVAVENFDLFKFNVFWSLLRFR